MFQTGGTKSTQSDDVTHTHTPAQHKPREGNVEYILSISAGKYAINMETVIPNYHQCIIYSLATIADHLTSLYDPAGGR